MLAVGLFLGMGFSSKATLEVANNIANSGNYHDLDILFPYGFSDEDVQTIKSLNDSYKAEAYYYAYEFLKVGDDENQIKLKQITNEIDTLYDIEGNLPSKIGEIAVDKTTATLLGVAIGDTITFENDTSENLEIINQTLSFDSSKDDIDSLMEKETEKGFLNTYTYKVTALVQSSIPMHSIKNMFGVAYTNGLNIDGFMYVTSDSFKKEAFIGYPGMLIKDESLNSLSLFSDEYKEKLDILKNNITSTVTSITDNKNVKVLNSVDEVIATADGKLDDGKKQIDEGEREIVSSENKIVDGQYQIDSGERKIAYNTKKLNEGQSQINDAQNQINEAEKEIKQKEQLLNEASIQIEDGKKQISQAEEEIAKKEKELELAQMGIEYIENYAYEEIEKQFETCDGVIDPIRKIDLSTLNKDELLGHLKNIVDSTYTLFNNQAYYYTELNSYEIYDKVFDDSDYYERIKTISFIKGENYIASYLKDNEEILNKFEDGDYYIEDSEEIAEILKQEEKDKYDIGFLTDDIENIKEANENETNKALIYDPILEDFYSNSEEEKLKETIKYLIDEYDAYKEDYHIGDEKLNSVKKQVEEGKTQLEEKKAELASKKQELEDGIALYNDGKTKLEDAKKELNNAKDELANYKLKLESGKSELNDAIAKLNTAKIRLSNAKIQLSEAKEKLSDAKEEYSKSKKTIDDFKNTRQDLKTYDASYIASLDNPSIASFKLISGILNKIKFTMASLFLIIGLLVCYFSILRMVNEHIKLIGTKKALGFYTSEITKTYVLFTGISTIVGCILGVAFGTFGVQKVIMSSVISVTTYNGEVFDFNILETITICMLEIVLLLGITFGATKLILRENAITLLAGPNFPSGKPRFYEKLKIWKNISLFNKTIINNCVADKRRVFGTLVGVCGCTALIVTALMLNNALSKNFNKQFDQLFHFDAIVYYDGDSSKDELNQILDKYNVSKADVLKTCTTIRDNNGNSLYSYLIVPENVDDFKKLVDMEAITNKDEDPYKGLWVTYSYKNIYGNSIDDEYRLTTLTGVNADIKASGYFGYYLTVAQIFMDKDTYSDANSGDYSTNAILINTNGIDVDKLKAEMSNVDGFIQMEDFKGSHKEAFDVMRSLALAIVIVYTVLSIAMAILVLLNLYTMFVVEKKKELITLMINGYSVKDARKYITKDTVLLTGIGVILGMVLGTVFGYISIDTFNNYACYVYKEIDIPACLIGAFSSIILSFIMCKIALKKINKFKMADINN